MFRRARYVLFLTGLTIFALTFSQLQAFAADFTLKVADTFPANHYIMENMTKVWMKAVTEKSGGRVEFKYFPGGQLGKLSEMLDVVENGVADVAYVPPSSYADRIPLTGVIELPGLVTNTIQGSTALLDILDNYLAAKEFKAYGVKPIMAVVVPPYQIGANRDPINTVDGFDGVRLRTPGGVLELAANSVGALAIPMSGPETYTAFQRGTVDATLQSMLSMRSYKLFEVFKSVSDNVGFGTFGVIYVIKEDVFNKLPKDIQQIIVDTGRSTSLEFAKWMNDAETKVAAQFKDKGLNVYSVPDDVWAVWQTKLATVTKQWAERADSRGLSGSETLAKCREAIEKANKN